MEGAAAMWGYVRAGEVKLAWPTANDDLDCATRNADRAANGQSTGDC